jgi:arabinose-5-phosphate isomerase
MTGNPNSSLARLADVHLDVSVPVEACPLGWRRPPAPPPRW